MPAVTAAHAPVCGWVGTPVDAPVDTPVHVIDPHHRSVCCDGIMTDAAGFPEPFDCPRCDATTVERLYGPCEDCRAELRAMYDGQARDVDTGGYVPKMNVTPNAVALKDD